MAFDFTSRPPRPRKDDRLFRCDLPCESDNVRLCCDPDAYKIGYRRAAEHVVQYVLGHPRESGSLTLPFLFLYRHHVELALKRIIYCTPGLLRRDLTKSELAHLEHHDLCQLWHDLEPILASIFEAVNWKKPKAEDLDGIREYVRQLAGVDPFSTRFRYWKSKGGNSSLPATLPDFNIRHFSEMMGRLADFLEALDTATTAVSEMLEELDNAH